MNRQQALRIAKTIGIWIPTLMLAFVFTVQGFAKFSDTSGWVRAFQHWGYPDWFRMLVGATELTAGILVLWRRTAPIAALMILCVMVGAMATHTFIDGKPRESFHEAMPFAFATIVLIARRGELRWTLDQLSKRRAPAPAA